MKKILSILFSITLLVTSFSTVNTTNVKADVAPYAFIALGQSNMVLMSDDLENDLQSYYGPDTILIRGAVNGSSINDWQKGQPDYQTALILANTAISQGYNVQMILINQGESDAHSVSQANAWLSLFWAFTRDFRADIGYPYLPVVYSQLGIQPTYASFDGWQTLRTNQLLALNNHAAFDIVQEYPFGPYQPNSPHYYDNATGLQGIALQYMRYITSKIPLQ